MFILLSVCLLGWYACLFACLPQYFLICLFDCLFVCLFACLSFCFCMRVCVHVVGAIACDFMCLGLAVPHAWKAQCRESSVPSCSISVSACLGFVVFPVRFSLNHCAVSYADGSGIPRDPLSLRHRLVCLECAAVVKELTHQAGTNVTICDMPMYFMLLSLKIWGILFQLFVARWRILAMWYLLVLLVSVTIGLCKSISVNLILFVFL